MKLTLRTLLFLIIQAKKTGTGRIGNGKTLVQFLLTCTDADGVERSHERSILAQFCENTMLSDAYKSMNRRIDRFLREGKGYPHEKLTFTNFERNMGNIASYRVHLAKMAEVCAQVLDESKTEQLVHTLLEILRQDDGIQNLPYGCGFIPKSELFGTFAHRKRICSEALLLGLFYLTHKQFSAEFSENPELLALPEKLPFHVVHYVKKEFSTAGHGDLENLLHPDFPLTLRENLHENAKRPYAAVEVRVHILGEAKRFYPLAFRGADGMKNALPKEGNVFLYGMGGVGKTTILLDEIHRSAESDAVNFLLPLQRFYVQNIPKFRPFQSNWMLSQILLKYHYQHEFHTLEACIADEGEDAVLQQLSQLHALLEECPNGWKPQYSVLLDGFNEISTALQTAFLQELKHALTEWRNVRFVITGRSIPQQEIFRSFGKIEVLGITDEGLSEALADFPEVRNKSKILEILRIPLFLNLWLSQNSEELCSRGKLLDAHVNGFSGSEEIRFAVQYILPFAARKMAEYGHFTMYRSDLSKAVEDAFSTFLEDERVYQNCLAPLGFRREHLQNYREQFVDMLLEELCYLCKNNENSPEIRFEHQYFRDYFAARCIVLLTKALFEGCASISDEDEHDMFRKYDLGGIWFPDRETEIYRMIGEIFGDDRNRYQEDFWYEETPLDGLLNRGWHYSTFRLTENIIRTMAAARDNLICGVDFSRNSLPLHIPCDIKFSKNGEEPCDFSECRVFDIGFADSSLECVAASEDGTKQLLRSEDGYGLLWDAESLEVLAEYWGSLPMDLEDLVYYEDAVPIEDDAVKAEIAARLTHFTGCDFYKAYFGFENTKEILGRMGAEVD